MYIGKTLEVHENFLISKVELLGKQAAEILKP
jgi:hypothetical protein